MPHSLQPVKPGEPVAADRFNEVIDRLNVVSGITGVYPIEVQRQAGGLQVSLARQFKAWLFEIQPFDEPAPTTTDGVPYYGATRVRLDASDEYAAHEPADVALFDPLAKDQPQRQLHEGDWALATYNADNGRWEIVRDPSGRSAVVRFRTTATLALGGSAAATIRTWDGAAYIDGSAITVEDWSTPGRWSAVNGAEGVAVKLEDKAEYVILWIEHQSIFATATLTANMTAGTAACTFTDTWQGPSGIGAAAQVYDVNGLYAGLLIGDKVLACWDNVEGKYKICDGPQSSSKPKWAYATANWVNGTLNTSKVVCEAATGKDGVSAGGGTFDVWLPRPSASQDPNVRQGAIIAYLTAEDGNRICCHGYLDDCLGTIKLWSGSAATIKPGWHLCDGGAGTIDLREKFVLGAFGDAGGSTTFDSEVVDGVLQPGNGTDVGDTGGLNRKLVNWKHERFGSPFLRTEKTRLYIRQTEPFRTDKEDPPLAIHFTNGGYTDFAISDVLVYDPTITTSLLALNDGKNPHFNHYHPIVRTPIGVVTDIFGTKVDQIEQLLCNPDPTAGQTGPQYLHDLSPENCVAYAMQHEIIEPGERTEDTITPHPRGSESTPGHRHPLSSFTVILYWGFDPTHPAYVVYDGHYHWVLSDALTGKLTIYDITHQLAIGLYDNEHYHDILIDNHQEFITRVPPYYALCYIQRVD